jgi:steroid delta-isomerase-like uncharacterized protein
MSSENNLALARRFFNECWNQGAVNLIDDFLATEHVHHFPEGDVKGPENIKNLILEMRTAFPDFHLTIDDEIAAQDKVVFRWTCSCTHLGDFYGIAPTGNTIEYTGIVIIRFANGRIVELWNQVDQAGFDRQLKKS